MILSKIGHGLYKIKTGRTIIIKDNNPSRLKILPKCGGLNIFIFQKITANLACEIERTASNERSAVLLYIIYRHAASFCRVGHRRTVGAIFIGKLAQASGFMLRGLSGAVRYIFSNSGAVRRRYVSQSLSPMSAHTATRLPLVKRSKKALSAEAQPSL